MRLLRVIFAGVQSLLAALLVAGGAFVPAWYAHVAIDNALAPTWVYGCVALLVLVSASVVMVLLSKAWRGIPPLKD